MSNALACLLFDGAFKPVIDNQRVAFILPGKRARTLLGIYEVDGGTLKWCVDNRQKNRPTEFRTIGGKFLLILKRKESPAGQPKPG